ncbi:MAG: glycosyltransferase family 4 protein [Planctomycetes bacterium]|nr:glycosyltransferase family 4 protein [Planctomycetota bacterium]
MDYALIAYPLSSSFKSRFEASIGSTPTYLSIAELRRLPIARMVATLARLPVRRLFVPLEDVSSEAVLPVLRTCAAISPAASREVVRADLRRERFSRFAAPVHLATIASASAHGQWSIGKARRECDRLLEVPRVEPAVRRGEPAAYLNANLWFGFKAGGSVGHISGVLNAFHRRGQRMEYVSPMEPWRLDPTVRVHTTSPLRHYGFPFEANMFRFHRIFTSDCVRRFRGQAYRFLYQRMSLGNYSGAVLSRRFRIPLVLEYNGSEVWCQKHWGRPLRYAAAAEKAEEVCLRHAHLVVTVSDVLRDELAARGVEPERIVSHPNAIDPTVLDPGRFDAPSRARLRARYGIPGDAVLAMFLGTFGKWHGVEVLARAIRDLVLQDESWVRRTGLRFLLIGDGAMMGEVRTMLDDPRIAPFVSLPGLVPQDDGPEHLAAADILLSPHVPNADGSPFFGSPTKLFEYMAMGKAILASDLNQIGEVLRPALFADDLPRVPPDDSIAARAVLCRPGDTGSLTTGLRFLVQRADWRRCLGGGARDACLRRFTWEHHVGAIEARCSF